MQVSAAADQRYWYFLILCFDDSNCYTTKRSDCRPQFEASRHFRVVRRLHGSISRVTFETIRYGNSN